MSNSGRQRLGGDYFGIHTRTSDNSLFDIQGLRDVVVGARREAFGPWSSRHGLGGQRDDRQILPLG